MVSRISPHVIPIEIKAPRLSQEGYLGFFREVGISELVYRIGWEDLSKEILPALQPEHHLPQRDRCQTEEEEVEDVAEGKEQGNNDFGIIFPHQFARFLCQGETDYWENREEIPYILGEDKPLGEGTKAVEDEERLEEKKGKKSKKGRTYEGEPGVSTGIEEFLGVESYVPGEEQKGKEASTHPQGQLRFPIGLACGSAPSLSPEDIIEEGINGITCIEITFQIPREGYKKGGEGEEEDLLPPLLLAQAPN